MPIKVQNDLPARAVLESENIFMMDESRAATQDIRPLEIVILNLMPLKQSYETQLLRALSNTPLQVEVTYLTLETHESRHTSASHLNKFYTTFSQIRKNHYDGMIITGAPVETMAYEEVNYWGELSENPCHVHLPCVLGSDGRHVLPFWDSQNRDAQKTFRRVPPPRAG